MPGGVVVLGALVLALAAAVPANASSWKVTQVATGTNSTIGQTLVITHPTPGGGVVTSDPPGLSCETFFCGAEFAQGSLVTLTATPRKGFAFAGYTDACTGPACSLTMDGEKRVTVSFVRFAEQPYSKPRQIKKDGTAVLTIRVGGPGRLVLSGKDVKRQVSEPGAASNVKLPIVAKGAAAKKLETNGRARVGVKVAYTPTEGTVASLSRSVQLIRASG